MVQCNFCNIEIEKGTGKMLVRNSGKVIYFCSSKCEKNMLKLNRKPTRTKWSGLYVKNQKSVSKQ